MTIGPSREAMHMKIEYPDFCPMCASPLRGSSRACPECGYGGGELDLERVDVGGMPTTVTTAPPTVHCVHCGHGNRYDSTTCTVCGHRLAIDCGTGGPALRKEGLSSLLARNEIAFCPKCGRAVGDCESRECAQCGHDLAAHLADSDDGLVFRYSRGSYFGGLREYHAVRRGAKCKLSVRGYNGDFTDARGTVSAEVLKSKLVDTVFALDWDARYGSFGWITDGFSWGLEAYWGGWAFRASGYESFPHDYHDVTEEIERRFMGMVKERAFLFRLWS